MTSSQKPVDDIICSGVTPFLLFSQYGILYAEHQNIFPFRKLLFYSAQYFPVSEAKPHMPQLHFGLHLGAVCGSCGMRQKKKPTSVLCRIYTVHQWANLYFNRSDKLYSPLGIFAVLRYSFIALTNVSGLLK